MTQQQKDQTISELKELFHKAASRNPEATALFVQKFQELALSVSKGYATRQLLDELTYKIVLDRLEVDLKKYPDLKDRHDRSSIGNEAWIRLQPFLAKIEQGEDKSKQYIGWTIELTKHVLNDLVSAMRKHDARRAVGVDVQVVDAVEVPEPKQEDDPYYKVNRHLPSLPLEERICIRMKYQHRWNEAQIGQLLDLTTGQIGYRVQRAHDRLRELLSGDGNAPAS